MTTLAITGATPQAHSKTGGVVAVVVVVVAAPAAIIVTTTTTKVQTGIPA